MTETVMQKFDYKETYCSKQLGFSFWFWRYL